MRKLFGCILSFIFIVLTLLTSYQLYFYENFQYNLKLALVGLTVIFAILFLIFFWINQCKKIKKEDLPKRKKHIRRVRRIFICLLLVFNIVLAYGNYVYYHVENTLTTLTDVDLTDEVTTCHLYVKKESKIQSLNDKTIENMGTLSREDASIKTPLSQTLEKKYNFNDKDYTIYSYPTCTDLYIGLMEENVDVIAFSDEELTNMKEYSEDFLSTTRSIGTLQFSSSLTSDPVDVTKEGFNVLLLGVDIREEEGTIKTNSRTDTIMVASFNPTTMQISLVSIPRDSYVLVGDDYDKITHAGMDGIAAVIDSVENLLDIHINYFAKFNFNALVQMIDAINGININVDYGFCEQDSHDVPDAICLEEGYQHLDGEQALAYARHRKTVTDHIRNNAQQQVIKGITDRLTSVSILTNFNSLLKVLANNMLTNFTKKELYSLAGLAPNLGSLNYQNTVLSGEDDLRYIAKYGQELAVTYLDDDSISQAHDQIITIAGH
mgnify:FL=1